MRRKSYFIFVLLSIASALLFGCREGEVTPFTASKENGAVDVFIIPLNEQDDLELTECTIFGNKVYYLVQFRQPMLDVAERSEIYGYDIATETSSLLYSREDPETVWLNELRADGERLYWTRRSSTSYYLESLSLETKEVQQIYSARKPIVLGGNNEYLAWYDAVTDDEGIVFYDTKTEKVSAIRPDSLSFQTWARPSLNKNRALAVQEENETLTFSLVDVASGQTERLFTWSKERGCVTPQLSEKYIVWRDKFGGSLIYAYDIERDQTFDIDTEDLGIDNVFSVHLSGDTVYINTGNDLWCLKLGERTYAAIAKDKLSEMNPDRGLTLAKISFDNQYVIVLRNHPDSDRYAIVVRPR